MTKNWKKKKIITNLRILFFWACNPQYHTQTYYHTVESVWAPKKWGQIFKYFTNFA